MIDEREQELDGAPPDAGMTEREARRLQRQDQTDHGIGQRRAEAAHVRQHETPLQLLDLVRRDAHRRELAEPGIDAVDGALPRAARSTTAAAASTAGQQELSRTTSCGPVANARSCSKLSARR